jgi:hypothetical protein
MAERALRDSVAEWLEKEGYSVEMRAARAFRARDFRVHQAHFFTDPITSETRELDLLITRQGDIGGRKIRVVFVIECKKSLGKPWVMFTDSSVRLSDPERVSQRTATSLGRRLLNALASDHLLADTGFFRIRLPPGYAVTTAHLTEGKGGTRDSAYYAISSVAAATVSLVRLLEDAPIAAIFFPLVLLDGHLFDCHLAQDGKPEVTEVDGGVLVWRKPAADMPRTIIHVVTSGALDRLVEEADRTAHVLFHLNPELVDRALGKPSARLEPDDPMIDF